MSQQYTVTVANNSTMFGSFCIYQSLPDITDPNIMSLAWLTKAAFPGTQLSFQWGIDYSFVWDDSGPLEVGSVFTASQMVPCDPAGNNNITLVYSNGAYNFTGLSSGGRNGTLFISGDESINPVNSAAVGIAMSGAGTFVQPAQPNMDLVFSVTPTYWITYGNYTPGQVIQISDITHTQQLTFPTGCYELDVTLQRDNSWLCSPAS